MNSLENRLDQIQKTLLIDEAFLFEDPYDLFYLSGKDLSLGSLIVTKDKNYLLVDGRYFNACKTLLHFQTLPSEKTKERDLLPDLGVKKLYFDASKTSHERFLKLEKEAASHYVLQPKVSPLKGLRMVKTKEEIQIMKQNALDLYSCFEAILPEIREGISEKELSTLFKIIALAKGASGFSFEPIIAFGANSAYPHHRSSDRVLKKGDLILIDVGIEKNHYQSDMTRVVFFGDVSQELTKLYDIVLASHDAALSLCKKGTKIKDLDLAAREVMKKQGVEDLFTHGLGHGIGLETHEAPRIRYSSAQADLSLKPGMVFTIEPGLYIEGKGGIRYEDTIVITEEGYENFFPSKMALKL